MSLEKIDIKGLSISVVKEYAKKYLGNTRNDRWTDVSKINETNVNIVKRLLIETRPDFFYNGSDAEKIAVNKLGLTAIKKYAKKYFKNTTNERWTDTSKINNINVDIIRRLLLKTKPDIFYNEINICLS